MIYLISKGYFLTKYEDAVEMEPDKAFEVMDESLYQSFGEHFSDAERGIFLESWTGSTYEEMAVTLKYATGYLSRTLGPGLWESLSKVLGEEVKKPNFRWAVMRYIEAKESRQTVGFSSSVEESCEGVLTVYSEELEPYVNEEKSMSFESTKPNDQEILCGIKTKNVQAGDITQESSQHCTQKILTDAEVEGSTIVGNITQKA